MKQSLTVRVRGTAGFTLVETLVAVLVVSMVMGAAFMGITHAMRLGENARLSSGMNNSLRSAMDVVVRDLIQAGQGLPDSKRVGIPNGTGTTLINRPAPSTGSTDPAGFTSFTAATSLPAVSVGYQLGFNSSDVITVIAADSRFENINVTAATGGTSSASATVVSSRAVTVTNGGPDNIAVGDLIDVRYNGGNVLMTVTSISGQTLNFAVDATNDPLGLNQFGATKAGSATLVLGTTPTPANVTLTRVKMITYYLFRDSTTDSRYPRLIRRVNGGAPATVAFGIENFTMTYDLATVDTAWVGVNMSNSDAVVGDGACIDSGTNRACSEDWIRKINVVLAGRSLDKTAQGNYMNNTLFSEVATRSLAFQDRFR
jgi:type II secretory pathway pseudopilin PulG